MKTIFFYAMPAFALAMIGLVYFAYLPAFYSVRFAESLGILGAVIIGTRILDAVLDPVVGRLSDRGFLSFGRYRRKQFIPFGAVLLGIGFVAVSIPDVFIGSDNPGVFFAIWSIVLFTGWTFFAVPYEALGAELSFDYHERSKIFGYRDGAIALGTLSAVICVEVLKRTGNESHAFFWFAFIALGILFIATTGIAFFVKEIVGFQKIATDTPGFFAPLKNKAFRSILIAFTLSGFGAALPATLLLFYVRYVLGADYGGYYLGLYLLCCVTGFPLWVTLCRSIEKRRAWVYATLVNSGAFLFTLLLGAGDFIAFAVIVIISGLGFAGTQLYPSSMQADVIDLEESRTGIRQEGAFVGLWSVSRKCAAALGAGIALSLLGLSGFNPKLAVQPEAALSMLSILYAGVPALCALGSLLALFTYPISRAEHVAISNESGRRWSQGITVRNGGIE